MLLNTYLGSLRMRREYASWADTMSEQAETMRMDLQPRSVERSPVAAARGARLPAGLATLVNLALVRRGAGLPAR